MSLYAQQAAPAPQAPAATPPPEPEADSVLATFSGRKLTYGELKHFMGGLPPQMQQAAMSNRRSFVQQFALLWKLSQLAEQAKLAEKSPTKEQLEFSRMQLLANAQINSVTTELTVPPEEVRRFYDAARDRFTQARVKVLYVSFSNTAASPGAKKALTEPEAKAKIQKLLADIRKGTDFVKLVKEHSEDQTSAAKDGDFGVIRRTDNVPEAIRAAVFALKPGEVSEPVRQPNGYYLFRNEELTTRTFDQVKDEIFEELRQARFKKWMEDTQRALDIQYLNDAFFNAAPPPAPRPPSLRTPAPAK